jgi:hypothetical protein
MNQRSYSKKKKRRKEEKKKLGTGRGKIWNVLFRIVSTTRTCHPASAMLPPEFAPMRVGL